MRILQKFHTISDIVCSRHWGHCVFSKALKSKCLLESIAIIVCSRKHWNHRVFSEALKSSCGLESIDVIVWSGDHVGVIVFPKKNWSHRHFCVSPNGISPCHEHKATLFHIFLILLDDVFLPFLSIFSREIPLFWTTGMVSRRQVLCIPKRRFSSSW